MSYTAQGIPGDPVNLAVAGSLASLDCAFRAVGWTKAESVSLRTVAEIGASVLLSRPYPDAPVSPLTSTETSIAPSSAGALSVETPGWRSRRS